MGLSTTYTKVETDYLLQELQKFVASGIKGILKITDTAPTEKGLYILSDVGAYTNLGGLVATTDKLNYAYFDGTTWSKVAVEAVVNNNSYEAFTENAKIIIFKDLVKNIFISNPNSIDPERYDLNYVWLNHDLGKIGLQLKIDNSQNSNYSIPVGSEVLSGQIIELQAGLTEPLKQLGVRVWIEFNTFNSFPASSFLEFSNAIFKFKPKSVEFFSQQKTAIKKTTELTASVNGTADFVGKNAIQNALNAIKDATINNRYKINVLPSLFKITNSSEFIGNTSSYPAMIRPIDHVDIVGKSKEDCIVWAELPYNDGSIDTTTGRNMHQTVWNWADDVTIENLTFVAKNIRYTVHQDNPTEAYKSRKYKNCDFIFIGNKGSIKSFGLGTWSGSKTYVEGGKSECSTQPPVAIHNSQNEQESALWSFKNHQFISNEHKSFIQLQNSGSLIGDDCYMEGCYWGGNSYILQYMEWWIYTPNLTDSFNHSEWRIRGFGNAPFLFKNDVDGASLAIKSNSGGGLIRFDSTSSAFNILIRNKRKYFGNLGHPERKITDDGHIYFDGVGSIKGYAIGCVSVKENDYYFGTNTSQDSMGKRLGDCSVTNKTLGIYVNGTLYNVVFNKNYTNFTNSQILTEINAVIGSVATAYIHNIGQDYYPEFTDMNVICMNGTNDVIPQNSIVTLIAGKVQICGENQTPYGVAIDEIAPYEAVNGEYRGRGRVIINNYFSTIQSDRMCVKTSEQVSVGDRFKVVNGSLVEDVNGSIHAFDNNVVKI